MKIRQKHIGGAAVAFVVLAMLMGYTTSQLTIYGTSVQNPVDVNATNIIDAPLIQQGGKSLNQTIDDRDTDTTYTAGNGVTLDGTEFSSGTNTMLNTTDWPTCGAGDFTTNDGSVFTCATPTDTTYTAGNGVTLVGTEFSAGTATTLNLTDLPTCGAGDFATVDGSVFTCDTPAGGGAGQPNIDTANITSADGVIPVAIVVTDSVTTDLVDTPIIQDAAAIAVKPNGEADDFFEFSSDNANLFLTTTHASDLTINPADRLNLCSDGVANADCIWMNSDTGGAGFLPGTDSEGSIGTTTKRFAAGWFDSINGADIGFLNGVTMVECVDSQNRLDICFVYGEITEDQVITRSIAKHAICADYLAAVNYEDFMSCDEFNSRKESITVDGKIDLTMGRPIFMSIRDVKETMNRLDEVEESLCNNGVQKYC